MYFLQKIAGMIGPDTVKVVEYKEIGKVNYIRKSTIRNLKITVRPFRNVQVNVPPYISFEAAGRFVIEKQQWIKHSQARFKKYKSGITIFDESTEFRTRDHVLILGHHEKQTIRTVISNGRIMVNYPEHADAKDPRIQAAIRKAILAAWRLEAERYLPGMIQKLADKYRFHYNHLTFRDNRTRWGSCSVKNDISLSIHLVRLPQHLCEYVMLHELCHIRFKNHQKAFWQLLDSVTGGTARPLDRELNGYSPDIW